MAEYESQEVSDLPIIQMNDFVRQWAEVEKPVSRAVCRVATSGWYVLGEGVEAFEKELAAQWNLQFAVGCGNGMDAIVIRDLRGDLLVTEFEEHLRLMTRQIIFGTSKNFLTSFQ